MPIDEKTRESRINRWKNLKSAWESKLAKASNENDSAVAKKMIAEAEGMIKRLESKDEIVQKEDISDKDKMAPLVKKTKSSHKKRDTTMVPEEEGSTSTLGL